jgi:CRISPR-associated protein Cas6
MFWSEDDNLEKKVESNDITDISIQLICNKLPGDHIYLLTRAIIEILPWIENDPQIAIQQIYIPASGNGWQREALKTDNLVYLSKRTRLKIRLPFKYLDMIKELTGKEVTISGHSIKFGNIKTSKITASEILVSRFAHIPETDDDEGKFLSLAFEQLKFNNVIIKKMLCGKSTYFNFAGRLLKTRSLMLADLSIEDSLIIQSHGIGDHYLFGCGVFIPQKGIRAVNQEK